MPVVTGSISATALLNATGEEVPGALTGSATTSNSVSMNSPSELPAGPAVGQAGIGQRFEPDGRDPPRSGVSVTVTYVSRPGAGPEARREPSSWRVSSAPPREK